MKTITINIYTAQELKDNHPKGFRRAHEDYKESCYNHGIAWTDEIMESFKAVFEHTDGITLQDYDIGYRGRGAKISFSQDEVKDLTGPRAMAWLENNLLYSLRVPFVPYTAQGIRYYLGDKRRNLSQYGRYYRPGMIKPCPFTGYGADDDMLESLQNDIKAGCTIGEAYHNLADVTARLLESEWENQLSEEYFIDHADANEWAFDESGRMI